MSRTLHLDVFALREIPSSVGQLYWLEELRLNDCNGWDWAPVFFEEVLEDAGTSPWSEILQGLARLTVLIANRVGMQSTDLQAIRSLSQLRTLECSTNPLTTLEPLRELSNLRELSVGSTRVARLEPLSDLSNLVELNCSGTRVSNLAPLRRLTNLRTLLCGSTRVSHLAPLRDLQNLAVLNLASTRISSLEPLRALENLTALNCRCTQARNLEPLRKLEKLSALDVASTSVADLSPLAALESLSRLDIRSTQVSDLSALRKLTNLTQLDCSRTRVSDLEPLRETVHLSELNCSSSPVSDLAPLGALGKLQTLNCSGTSVSSLEPLRQLEQLEHFECSRSSVADLTPLCSHKQLRVLLCDSTPVSDLTPVRELEELVTLLCSYTPVSKLEPLRGLTKLQLLFCGGLGLLRDVPAELTRRECSEAVLGFFRDLDAGVEQERRARVLLVGNGFAGKSTLAHCLIHREPPAAPIVERTHAIVSRDLRLDGIEARLWDFAGQEIYHATHRLFLRASGVFVLLWTESDPRDSTPTTERHSPGYWLDLIEWFGGGTIIAVKNKVDTLNSQPDPPELAARAKRIKYQLKIAARSNTGVNALRALLEDELKSVVDARAMRIGASWVRTRAALAARPEKHLSHAEFVRIAEAQGVLAPQALLTYLVNTGDAFHAPAAFGGRVFLDPSWIIDATYRMFDSKPKGPRKTLEQLQNGGEGTVTGTQLRQIVWPEAGEDDVRHYLAFLTSSEIVLEVDPNPHLSLPQRRFVIPALLPEVSRAKLQQLRDHTAWQVHLEFSFPLLHRALVERLLIRTSSQNSERQWWHDTAAWLDDQTSCSVLLEARPADNRIFVRISAGKEGDASEAVARVLLLMRESEQQLPYQVRLSDDDVHYATLDALESALRTNSDVACGDAAISRARFAAVYRALGTPVRELPHSGYGVASEPVPAKRDGARITIIDNRQYFGSVHMGNTYNSTTTNSPGAATAQGEHASAVASAASTQHAHREQIKRAQNALNDDQDSLDPAIYDALQQFLRLARELQVEQKALREAQADMKSTLDDVWAQLAAKGMKPKQLPETLEVIKALANYPITIEVAKKLIGI